MASASTVQSCEQASCEGCHCSQETEAERLQDILGVGDTTRDRRFTFEAARCIGAYGLAPAMSIGNVVYKQASPDELESILPTTYRKAVSSSEPD